MISNWSNLLARRDLLRELTLSELRSESQQSRLGWLWWLVDPLVMMLIYWGVVAGVFGRGERYAPYPVFILCAMLPWKHLSSALNSSAKVLRSREGLIKSIAFPTMALPITIVLAGFSHLLFGLVVLLATAWAFDRPLGVALVQVPMLLGLQLVLVTGASLVVACLGALVRDLAGFLSHLLRVLFYCSPTLYGIDLVRERAAGLESPWAEWVPRLYAANPLATLISGYREALFYGRFMVPGEWLLLSVECLAMLWVGYATYQYFDRRVIKFL